MPFKPGFALRLGHTVAPLLFPGNRSVLKPSKGCGLGVVSPWFPLPKRNVKAYCVQDPALD